MNLRALRAHIEQVHGPLYQVEDLRRAELELAHKGMHAWEALSPDERYRRQVAYAAA